VVGRRPEVEPAGGYRLGHGAHLGQRSPRERKVLDRRAEGPPMLSVRPGDEVSAPRRAGRSDGVVKARCVDHEIHRVLKPATWFAIAYQIGEPGRGFQHAMDFVINTSRLYNAVG